MRSFMKIAAMIMAVAMLCSFTALGAEITLTKPEDVDSDNPNVEIVCESDAAQTALLVYKGTALTNAEDIVYIDQYSEGADINPTIELPATDAFGDYTVVAGGIDVPNAVSETFKYTKLSYAVTLDFDPAKGYVTYDYEGDLNDVPANTEITFNFYPFMGYEITDMSVAGETVTPVKTGTSVKVVVTKQETPIKVLFEAVEAVEKQAFTSAEIYDIPADDKAEGEDALDSKLVFGKASAGAVEMGMYLQKWNAEIEKWEDAVTSKGVGPYFEATKEPINNQYGIRFLAFEAGRYQVKAYAKYADGTEEFGKAVVFEVK